jgi:glycosyltransferase involved in cell wall biosynthesis
MLPGRLTRWKGQHMLIEASARVRAHGRLQGVRILLVGDDQGRGGYRQELQDAIAELKLEQHVGLMGHCTDMPAALALAGLVVIPSLGEEAFGRVSVEGQAMGCHVIASDAGALPETLGAPVTMLSDHLQEREGGWLVPAGNAAALAEAMMRALAAPPDSLAHLKARAAANARINFTASRMQTLTLSVYDKLLGTQLAQLFRASTPYET